MPTEAPPYPLSSRPERSAVEGPAVPSTSNPCRPKLHPIPCHPDQCNRLVWLERYQYVRNAINREKQIKGWRRSKKIWLIEQTNRTWADLSEEWRQGTADPSATLRSGRDDKG
jgi:hypothetical protein